MINNFLLGGIMDTVDLTSENLNDSGPDALILNASIVPKLSLAQQQNSIPVISDLYVENNTDMDLNDVELHLTSDPLFLTQKIWHIDRINAGSRFHIRDVDIEIMRSYLADLREAVKGSVIFSLKQNEEEIKQLSVPIDVLAPDEWGGISYLPELTAAYCCPNDPSVSKVLLEAAECLSKAGLDVSLEGYQKKDRKRVWELISATYNAVASHQIVYANPPASFENNGQKVRPPSRILEEGLGTCFDLALLFSSVLEQIGLNPLILITKDHAFAGCWLVEEDFSIAAQDDAQALRKRVKLGELILIETTFLTKRPAPNLKQATTAALAHLDKDDDFHYAIDIKRSRMNSIRPLMFGGEKLKQLDADQSYTPRPPDSLVIEEAPILPDLEYITTVDVKPDSPEGRIERWKRRLLDLTLRNNLLNFKQTKRALPIFCPDPAKLEDQLAEGDKLKFIPMPDVMDGNDPRSSQIHQERHSKDAKEQLATESLSKKELLINLSEKDLEGRLIELYRKARNDLEEGGANTLFLAIGFLKWKQEDNSERVFKAPLLLLPVSVDRKSVISGFRMTLIDDDPVFNPTLLQMLRQDYGLSFKEFEDELPRDHSGIDVPMIWQIVRKAIREKKGWEVVEDVYISTFSFTKYLMWKDLQDRTDLLKKNPVVKHLIDTPRDMYPNQGEFPSSDELDDRKHPRDTFCPMIADSSQLSAVFAAAEGKNYVLVGPPGTGKSQTITNIIVQCLAEGKTVLFVSEKMAALDVVYRRLREVGMSSFCLELHSSKARKMDVLEQLGIAWNASKPLKAEDWEKEALKLEKLRKKLNKFPKHLHEIYQNGLSPFKALSTIIGNAETLKIDFSWTDTIDHSEDELNTLFELVDRLGINAIQVGEINANPFAEVTTGEWSRGWQSKFEQAADALLVSSRNLKECSEALLKILNVDLPSLDMDSLSTMNALAALLPQAYGKSYDFAGKSEVSKVCKDLSLAYDNGITYAEQHLSLSINYSREVIGLDLDTLAKDWGNAQAVWWPMSFFQMYGIKKKLLEFSSGKPTLIRESVADDITALIQMKSCDVTLSTLENSLQSLGADWKGLDTSWPLLLKAKEFAEELSGLLTSLSDGDIDKLMVLRSELSRILKDGNDFLNTSGPIGVKCQNFVLAYEDCQKTLMDLRGLIAPDTDKLLKYANERSWYENIEKTIGGWQSNIPKLRVWCAWRNVRAESIAKGLNPVVDALEGGLFAAEEAVHVFDVNYKRWWLDIVVDADPVLRDFVSAEHERSIKDFKELDQKFMELTPKYIRAKLSGNIPSKNSMSGRAQTEWGVLNRELNKKARHMPLRKLVNSLPNVLTKLTPCILMSPLSIAQYLSADSSLFDVVVFDEASQIPVWDAIGAIARGKQSIVVGDPKQLPPTSFFGRSDDKDDDDDLEVEDLESILDECMGASLPTLYLDRHYRSRHESLITFSNHRYYQSRLVTFPSSVTNDTAVSYHHVPDGVFERSGARLNVKEAQAVAEAVLAWLKNPEFISNKWTIGVVTFNQQQQKLIMDLLDDARRDDPSIEEHFNTENIEPVFVKNLENVQGDERDIIIFSVTYGPAPNGRMYMNFGPLNKEGGERRLNVAITRARQEMHVYGTLRGEDVDLSRTKAIGVRDFKHFLEFAEKGKRAIAEAIDTPRGDFDSPFEAEVAQRLTAKGWDVHTQIGASNYRVDLGIVHPDSAGRYIAGVECDGATYHSSANARERDRLREMVLRGLGWNIVRIWSTDWWLDPASSTEKIHKQLQELLEKDRNKPEPELLLDLELPEVILEDIVEQENYAEDEPSNEPIYSAIDLSSICGNLKSDNFHEYRETNRIKKLIEALIENEAPISLKSLADKISRAYGFKQTGSRILNRIHICAKPLSKMTKEGDQTFLWPKGVNVSKYDGYRVSRSPDICEREIDHICLVELTNLARYVQGMDCPLDNEDLKRCMGERIGYRRMTKKVSERLGKAIDKM